MRRWFFLSSLLLVVLAGWLLTQAPAKLINQYGAKHFPQLRLEELDGTLWTGTAKRAYWQIGGSALPLGQLYWQMDWQKLTQMQLGIQFYTQADEHRFDGSLTAIDGGIRIEKGNGQFPLALLEAWVPLLVSAEVKLNLQQLDYSHGRFTALTGFLSADQVTWEVGDYDMPLGDYQADVALLDNQVVLLIEDVQAALGANAEMRFSAEGHYQFNAVLSPREHLAPEVARVIGWLGKREQSGQVIVSQQGRWQ